QSAEVQRTDAQPSNDRSAADAGAPAAEGDAKPGRRRRRGGRGRSSSGVGAEGGSPAAPVAD
ncbi:MAG: ATP-dependent helicase, partial [Actinomycetota bacterium]